MISSHIANTLKNGRYFEQNFTLVLIIYIFFRSELLFDFDFELVIKVVQFLNKGTLDKFTITTSKEGSTMFLSFFSIYIDA